jgi:hypothetical protein
MEPIAVLANERSDPDKATTAARRAKDILNKYVVEALRIEKAKIEEQVKKLQGLAPPAWPAWPYWDAVTVGTTVSKELRTPEDSIREITWRLKQVRYPYQGGTTRNRKTFYRLAKSRNILIRLLEPPLLGEIRHFWWLQKYDEGINLLKTAKKSEYGIPLALHRELAFALSAHLAKLETRLQESQLGRSGRTKNRWLENFHEYRAATLKQILNEAAIVYPEVQYRLMPAAQLKTKDEKIPAQVQLFERIRVAMKDQGADSHKFAFHLTSLLSTSSKMLIRHRLSPTPETVRRNIEVWMTKNQN